MDDSRSILVIGLVALLLLLSATGAIIAVNSNSNDSSDTRETAETNYSYNSSQTAAIPEFINSNSSSMGVILVSTMEDAGANDESEHSVNELPERSTACW